MFLLNSFCNKYFAMNASFRISLLYLLLIIPQHGNSPLPVMESWLQKDQDDGFVQRDMTSSLTGGDESFGSAHQTYQNSLIRKKKSENTGNPFPASCRNFAGKFDTNQRYEEPDILFNNRVENDDYNADADDNERDEAIFEEFDSPSGLPSDKYRSRWGMNYPNSENLEPQFMNDFSNYRYSDFVPSKDVSLYSNQMAYMRNNRERNGGISPFGSDLGDDGRRSMYKRLKARYAMNPLVGYPQSLPVENRESSNFPDSLALQDNYFRIGDERSHEINNEGFRDDVQLNERLGGKNPQIFQENNEYYDADTNPFNGEEDLNVDDEDYRQMLNDHSFIHKRDETRQFMLPKSGTGNQQSDTAEVVLDSLKSREPSRSLNDAISIEEMKEDLGRAREADNMRANPDSDSVWQLNKDLNAQALNNVLKSSQRALQEVQMFQQRLALKPQDGGDKEGTQRGVRSQALSNTGRRNPFFDEKRLKREDEDEQKNMKTGTDEGGGGEYEDEEGKGHKDEEEYYEDADLSDDESGTKIQTTDDLNQKYVKREITQDANLKNQKEEQNDDNNSQDYELNLDNAPVENSEKSRKTSLHSGEGEKTNKNSVRKGVKIWDQWGKWSPCSVTCGVGRSTRWRHCIGGGCAQGEKEAQIKRCTNPAC